MKKLLLALALLCLAGSAQAIINVGGDAQYEQGHHSDNLLRDTMVTVGPTGSWTGIMGYVYNASPGAAVRGAVYNDSGTNTATTSVAVSNTYTAVNNNAWVYLNCPGSKAPGTKVHILWQTNGTISYACNDSAGTNASSTNPLAFGSALPSPMTGVITQTTRQPSLYLVDSAPNTYGALYAGPGGNDSNNGSIGTPFLTAQKGANMIQPGQTLYLRAGTYSEEIDFFNSGTITAPITVSAYPGETVIIDGTSATPKNDGLVASYANNYLFQKLIIQNAHGGAYSSFWCSGLNPSGQNGVTLDHCTIKNQNTSAGAVRFDGFYNCVSNTVQYCDIRGNTTGGQEALRLEHSLFKVLNNTVEFNTNIGINISGASVGHQPTYGLVANNIAYCNGNGGYPNQIYGNACNYVVFQNNTCYSGGCGLSLGNETAGLVASNNILRNNLVYNNERMGLTNGNGTYTLGRVANTAIYANTLSNNKNAIDYGQEVSWQWFSTGSKSDFKNNVVVSSAVRLGNIFLSSPGVTVTATTADIDGNCWFPGTGQTYGVDNTTYTTLAAWCAAKGEDINSLGIDPKLKSDYTLSTSSPMIDAGKALTYVTAASSNSVIAVADARYFADGYFGLLFAGDTIKIGTGSPRSRTIKYADYTNNTLTLDSNVSVTVGDPVNQPYNGAAPDIGAFESNYSTSSSSGGASTEYGYGDDEGY